MNRIRQLTRRDIPELIQLCREHAAFERAEWVEGDREERLATLLLDTPSAHAFVAEGRGELAGFATANLELSTWDARQYLHLDCLYLREAYRGLGLGRGFLEEIARVAVESGAANLQWQTPAWNRDAVEFYEAMGATSKEKLRFTLGLEGCAKLAKGRTSD